MKAVLISIQPKWCELIASRKKTVEVRKTRPNMNVPFKCYIYCTNSKIEFLQSRSNVLFYCENKDFIGGHGPGTYTRLNGHVIGEFVCDRVDRIVHSGTCNNDIRLRIVDEHLNCKEIDYAYLDACKLSYSDIDNYSGGRDVYGWHISELVIYDKPKELNEFYKKCEGFPCEGCEHLKYQRVNADEYDYECEFYNFNYHIPITRPPQSWCYVEELRK